MAPCPNHPGSEATVVCARCGVSFCPNCTIGFRGADYCGRCKNVVVRLSTVQREFTRPRNALICSLIGVVCCGIILEPIAIWQASKALSEIRDDPTLPGKGVAVAALVVGICGLLFNIGVFVLRFALMGLELNR